MKKIFVLFFLFTVVFIFPCELPNHFAFSVQNNEGEVLYWGCYNAEANGPHIVTWYLTYERTLGRGRAEASFTQQRDGGQLLRDLQEAGFQMPTHADYTRSGFDRGHMAPNSHFNDTLENSTLTFFIGNIWPQTANVNRRGEWFRHEQRVDPEHAQIYDRIRIEVIVTEFTGQIIGREDRPISVPASFLRTAYRPDGTIIYQIIVINE